MTLDVIAMIGGVGSTALVCALPLTLSNMPSRRKRQALMCWSASILSAVVLGVAIGLWTGDRALGTAAAVTCTGVVTARCWVYFGRRDNWHGYYSAALVGGGVSLVWAGAFLIRDVPALGWTAVAVGPFLFAWGAYTLVA